MKPKNILIGLVALAAALAIWMFAGKPKEGADDGQGQPNQGQGQDNGSSGSIQEVPNALAGELQASNDRRRGNLMLLLNDSDRIIYLNTSRDFSALVGKQVTVSIEGSMDDFVLLDIKAR